MTQSFASLARDVRAMLGQSHRYAHCVRVARLADRLAAVHGEDTHSARTAGMLHDLARLYDARQLVVECERRGLAIDAFEREAPIVLHARLGAELARERFGIADEAILSAIRKHTLAARDMSPLDAILYLADGLEPGRDFPERPTFERLAFQSIELAMVALLRSSITYNETRNLAIAPQTLAALNGFERSVEAIGASQSGGTPPKPLGGHRGGHRPDSKELLCPI